MPTQSAPAANGDRPIDIYFSNERPDGVSAQNWVRTRPDQGFFVYIRYYGPLSAFNQNAGYPTMWRW